MNILFLRLFLVIILVLREIFLLKRFKIPLSIFLHLQLLLVQLSVLNNKLAVTNLLTSFQPSFTQSNSSLQLIEKNSMIPEEKEEIFFVSLTLFTFDIPIIFPGHLVLILFTLLVIYILSEI